MAYGEGETLEAFDAKLAGAHMRGQWTSDARRDEGKGGAWQGDLWEPAVRGEAHVWKWQDTEAFLDQSADAIPESFTARRSLMFTNPGLERSITHTMNVGVQLIKPGELAWAHRHSISALRFVIEGHPDLFTVADGEVCPMEDHDLVLTPGWHWHDHHNRSKGRAIWLDVLDGPLVGALNQTVFENYGEKQQPIRNDPPSGLLRYPWKRMEAGLKEMTEKQASPHDGLALEYRHPETGGSLLPTLGCRVQSLPPGFEGASHRHSSSEVYLVISGAGRTEVGDTMLEWGERDCFVVPAWAPHAHANGSGSEAAVLFAVDDAPALRALGLYRQDPATND
ncbi:MAG: cupin domain-containing protein [Proteobacteria bacterium]|nr:cupin domain-containing protein [Pseudomonadota bacterium]